MEREKDLVIEGSPCDVNYFDRRVLTLTQAVEDKSFCPNIEICKEYPEQCALRYGQKVASYVVEGSDLKTELYDFYREILQKDFSGSEFWNSVDREEFSKIRSKGRVLRAVENFARVVLLMDTSESVFPYCEKCESGVVLEKLIEEQGRIRGRGLAGTGRIRTRRVLYCPDCDFEPQNGIFYEGEGDDLV